MQTNTKKRKKKPAQSIKITNYIKERDAVIEGEKGKNIPDGK